MKQEIRRIKPDECPICHYEFKMCQCKYGGKSHPERGMQEIKEQLKLSKEAVENGIFLGNGVLVKNFDPKIQNHRYKKI